MADRTVNAMNAATFAQHSDLLMLVRTTEAAVGDQNQRITWETAHESMRWLSLYSDQWASTIPNYYWDGAAFSAVAAWTAATVIALGEVRRPTAANGYFYECVARAGAFQTGGAEPAWGVALGQDTVDNNITWRCRAPNVVATDVDLTDILEKGMPMKVTYNSVSYYHLIHAISASYIALCGPGLSTSHALTAVYFGAPEMVQLLRFWKDGDYDAGVADIACDPQLYYLGPPAYMVAFSMIHETDDTGANNGKVNMEIGGSVVSNDDTDNGLQLTTSWQQNYASAIKSANYKAEYGDVILPTQTAAGSNGDGTGLSVVAAMVLE